MNEGDWQNALDEWAMKTLPPESSGCITAWSDYIARFIVEKCEQHTALAERGDAA